MNIEPSKKTKENLGTIFASPPLCPKCEIELENKSYLMMGVEWECPKCECKWMRAKERIL